jgi:hypothetical protein
MKTELKGIICEECGVVLISYTRWDFKKCGCNNETYVDGGQQDYVRAGGKDLTKIKSAVITYNQDEEQTLS